MPSGSSTRDSETIAFCNDSTSSQIMNRSKRWKAGKRSNSQWWKRRYCFCGWTSSHGAVRWNSVSCATCGWMAGTNWIALAPVPITATRLPVRSTSWSHCAEWNAVPANVSRPGMAGSTGRDSCPIAGTRTSASSTSPAAVCTRHRPASSSNSAAVTSVPNLISGSTPYFAAVRRR